MHFISTNVLKIISKFKLKKLSIYDSLIQLTIEAVESVI